MTDLKRFIRDIPDFPKPGIVFKDITPLLADAEAFRAMIDALVAPYRGRIDAVLGIESRGFIIGAPVAYRLGVGFVPIRKKGKLPAETIGHDYELEYGADRVEIHTDAIAKGERVLLVDDLIATGGTAEAAVTLIRKMGGEVVECCFVIDLPDIGGRKRLEKMGLKVFALCEFEGD
jgi:adenine phosphoribosyltransferase